MPMHVNLPPRVKYWQYTKRKHDAAKLSKLKSRNDLVDLIPRHLANIKDSSESKRITGWEKFEALVDALARIDKIEDSSGEKVFKRDPVQVALHKHMIRSSLRSIFKNELPKALPRLKKMLGFDKINPNMLITAPRRFGKTYALAIFAFVFALTQKDVELPIFSPGRRASTKLLQLIFKIGCHYFGSTTGWHGVFNGETLEIKNIWGGVNIIRAYPSNAKISHSFFLFFFRQDTFPLPVSIFIYQKLLWQIWYIHSN